MLWVGGAPCGGKSSVAKLLGDRFDLELVRVDDAFDRHVRQIDQNRHPALSRWMALSWNERWMRAPEVLLLEVIACYREHLGFILDDLRAATPRGHRVLVEGSSILPAEIAPMLMKNTQAIWLLPAPAFQAQNYARREWVEDILRQCADPVAAFRNWMARDAAFASWLAKQIRDLGLRSIEVDGSRSIEEIADVIVSHFGLS